MELSEDSKNILTTLEDSWDHIFLTGNAGTGKSTLLDQFRKNTKKQVAVVAPTGVAAVNVKGETIHSFFKVPPAITPRQAAEEARKTRNTKIYQSLQTLIIDEISMVRADLLDSIDIYLKTVRKVSLPFGGVQLIMVGDLYQLPPVVTNQEREAIDSIYSSPFFFSANVFAEIQSNLYTKVKLIELEKIYRQNDLKFISVLNRIRNDEASTEDLSVINRQLISDGEELENYIILTAINAQADAINNAKLAEIIGVPRHFHAKVSGFFNENQSPAPQDLSLKTGARVMFLNNDPGDRWINGTVGTVFTLTEDIVRVKIDNGDLVDVDANTWTSYKTEFDQEKSCLVSKEVGSYKQIPLKLAWAVTIHKSQGKTFDRVAIDLGRGAFAHGQTYVALSRCTSLSGIKLLRPIEKHHIIMDKRVVDFISRLRNGEGW